MPSVQYGTGAYKRGFGDLPTLTLINMFVEKADTSESQIALQSRNGLGLIATIGSGPINGMFSKKGTLSGDVFSISNTALYRGTSAIASGTIAGTGVASFDGSDTEVLVTRGSTMRSYKAAGIVNVSFPDSAPVTAVCFIGSLFVAVRGDSTYPGRFYWSSVLDGRTWGALDYATAEREPDALLDIRALGDNLWLFGQQTIEAWAHTGDAALPFTRLENVAFDKGIHSTGAATKADNSLFFVGHNCAVYRISDVPNLISDSWLTEQIRASTTARMFTYWIDDHEMVALRLDDTTYVYDCKTQEWHENQTEGGQWIASHAVMVDKTAYFGHQTTGELMGWSEWDDMGVEMERHFSFGQQLNDPTPINTIKIWANSGHTPLLTGQGSDPTIELRLSDDSGNTWTPFDSEEFGMQGRYRQVPEWRALGQYDFPGILGEVRVTDPVGVRISAIKINDNGGGRARP